MSENNARGAYMLRVMNSIHLSGDSYTDIQTLFNRCYGLSEKADFKEDLIHLSAQGSLTIDNGRISSTHIATCENIAAGHLADILRDNMICRPMPLTSIAVNGIQLSAEQRRAISVSLSHRLSLILGGAGTGKTTLIQGIFRQYNQSNGSYIGVAPTGKAAVNLRLKSGIRSMTVHSLLGLGIESADDWIDWSSIGLIVIDEASMLTIEMLSGILEHCRHDCRIILVGDENQLQSVGAGNIMSDLIELGFPVVQLFENHRQEGKDSALAQNVLNYSWLSGADDIYFDDSFVLMDIPEYDMQRVICSMAAEHYAQGDSFQLLSPVNYSGTLSVSSLNNFLHPVVNPCVDKSDIIDNGSDLLWNGDRILVKQNNHSLGYCNGDIGILRMHPEESPLNLAALDLDGGRVCYLPTIDQMNDLRLGYAITVHKSQGGEYDSVILPLCEYNRNMFTRNLLYTAISRAKKQVILVGSREMLDYAIRNHPRKRNSSLVQKTRQAMDHSPHAA